ncbi:Tubulin Alpha-1B Chain [Manis pentadactyla]|nr:Tubulin Alpha-1B Chain [Manis pentadactyla]
MDWLSAIYGKKAKLKFARPPGFHGHGGTLQLHPDHRTLEHSYCAFMITKIMSTIIIFQRFNGALNMDLMEFSTNLFPNFGIHSPPGHYTLFIRVEKASHEQPPMA